MSKTTNLGLELTGTSSEDTSQSFLTWRQKINGESSDSNMNKIDAAVGDLKSAVDDIANITLDSKRIDLNFAIRTFGTEGYTSAQNRLASDPLPAGKYTIPSITGDYQYVVYNYVSDSEGSSRYSATQTGKTFTVQNQIVIIIRHLANAGQVFTVSELDYFNRQFAVVVDNTDNVVFATKTELSTAMIAAVNEAKDIVSPFTEEKTINIFDGTFPESGYFDADGVNASSSSYKRTGYISVDATNNTLYFLRTVNGYLIAICFYDEFGTGLGRQNIFTDSATGPLSATIAIPSTAKTFRMYTQSAKYTGDLMLSYNYYDVYYPYGLIYLLADGVVAENNLTDALKNKINSNKKFTGKTIAFMGDSIIGNFYDSTGVCAQLAEITGATVINCAFGGSRIAYRHGDNAQYVYWNALSGAGLADAIASGDWTAQDTAVANMTGGLAYFSSRLATVKSVDWSSVDFIMWEYGTNDFMTEVALTGNDFYAYDYSYRHAIETIQTAYPNIRIIPVTPIYRWYQSEGIYTEDSNTRTQNDYAGVSSKLTDFVAKAQAVSREYQLPCIDDYYTLGANRYTRLQYFDSTDGTHPNANGRKLIAEHIGAQLVSLV